METQILRFFIATALAVAVCVAAIAQNFSAREIQEWRAAADRGNAQAQYTMGVAYYKGSGVAEDKREAVRWWRKAAAQGHAWAQNDLGSVYYQGEGGVTVDKRVAMRWLRKAAEQGIAPAQYSVATSYDYGDGVAENKREAARWYRKAAAQGIALAQTNLGFLYWNGTGVAEDKREAVRWFRKAAERGDAVGQFNLGFAYDSGEGVAVNKREAARWYQKAAEQGDVNAQYNLGVAYWSGEGAIENEREAYVWFSIAKVNGNENAATDLRELNWDDFLSDSEIRSAKEDAARRLEQIEIRREASEANWANIGGVAIKPEGTNVAERVFATVWRSVVVVLTKNAQGSGVIVGPNTVATNCHVLEGGGKIVVYKSNNRRADTNTGFSARVRYADKSKDFCLLDVAGLRGVSATVRKYNTLGIGEDVYGLGAPQGLDLSLSVGVISQLRKRRGNRFIQTDTAISPGSSGGGLFDSDGNLVGIMTAKITEDDSEGIGFAIPADLVLGY